MQDASPIPHSLVGQIIYAITLLLSGTTVGGLLLHLLSRRRLNAESEARAAKEKAEARRLDSETIDRAYERIDELHDIVDELRAAHDRDRLELLRMSQLEYISQQQRAQLDQQDIELKLSDEQLKRINGLLHAHGIRLSELDEPKK
jgi:hypothetical protein